MKRTFAVSTAFAVAVLFQWGVSFGAAKVGKPAPKLALTDLAGKPVKLADLKGKVVLVDFWASWCVPCAKEMPFLKKLEDKYAKQGFVVIAVGVDEEKGPMKKFAAKRGAGLRLAWDSKHTVAKRYDPPTMPTSYFIDRKGILRHIHRGFRSGDKATIEKHVKKLLAAK